MQPADLNLPSFVRELLRRINDDVSLKDSARRASHSPFQLHRAFRRTMGETLKQYTLRLRLMRAAAQLATGRETVLAVALGNGFQSHEVFTRAFRRYFGITPSRYRARTQHGSQDVRDRQVGLVESIAPCLGLFCNSTSPHRRTPMPLLSIERREIAAQPVLFIRRRITAKDLQATLAECFGKLFGFAQANGLQLAGFPLARYVSTGPGLWTVEPAVPLAAPAGGEGEMQSGTLPGGPVAFAVHGGEYQELPETNAAIERWIEANGYHVGGAPWEWYVTDPAEHPNPADWRTEVYWPLAE